MVAAIESFWGHLPAFLRFGVPQFGSKDRPPLFVGSVLEAYVVETRAAGTSRDQDGTLEQDGGRCAVDVRTPWTASSVSCQQRGVKTDDTRSFDVAPGFSILAVGGLRGGELHKHKEHHGSFLVADPKVDLPKSIIFYPDSDPSLGSSDGQVRANFWGSVLGKIPNRGFQPHAIVVLTRMPYQQTVSNRLNEDSSGADLKDPVAIHFEQGLHLLIPATDLPKNSATISRLASIPHGTAFNAQDVDPQSNDSDRARDS
ncbi:hypothetical protein CLCR_08826 [Cladophialophora carrionii]|uniref:Uncharacterized protein n=1 Tax=Cladophialophora carrionii TaxID=86049 RepID=A0A1C1CTR2_9EURO|nr:hypothetical protein CLCR_08826 [Cladophialophora carrionii]